MASPMVDLCSSENSMSEDTAALELASKAAAAATNKDRNSSSKNEAKSPTSDSKRSNSKKNVSVKGGSAATWADDGGTEGNWQQQQSSSRKKRSRATPAEDTETNGRKSATDNSGRESSLWPGTDGDGPVQGSLLEEVLAEKRMALMRSPEVLRFLQQRQSAVQAAQQHAALENQQADDFSVGELEEDANS